MSLTPNEHQAMRLSAELWNTLTDVVGDGPTRDAALGELVVHIHAIQRAVLSQAAGRAHPDQYRLLGQALPADAAMNPPGRPAQHWYPVARPVPTQAYPQGTQATAQAVSTRTASQPLGGEVARCDHRVPLRSRA